MSIESYSLMGSAITNNRLSRSFFGKRLVLSAALGTFVSGILLAEHGSPPSAAAVPAQFAAASIRPSDKTSSTPRRACRGIDTVPDPQRAQIQVPLGRCTFEGARLDDLIVVAYSDDLSWIRNNRRGASFWAVRTGCTLISSTLKQSPTSRQP